MLNLHQLTTAAIAHHANHDESFHVKKFNFICNTLTDYMAYSNRCFTNTTLYLTRLHGITNQLPAAIHKALDHRPVGTDPVTYFYQFISGIYSPLMADNQVLADQVRWPMDAEGDVDFAPSFSKTVISIVPGKLVLDTNNSAMLGHDKSTVEENGYLRSCETFRKVEAQFRKFAIDPVYGDGRYGLMPLVMPLIPTSFSNKIAELVEFKYPSFYDGARKLFADAIVAKIDLDQHIKEFNDLEDMHSEQGQELDRKITTLQTDFDKIVDSAAEAVYETLQNLAFEYNEGYELSLPRKNYAISNNR